MGSDGGEWTAVSDVDEAGIERASQAVGVPRPPGKPSGPWASRDADATGAGDMGDARVDEALGGLVGLSELPLPGHVTAFEGIHAALQARLADTEG